MDVSSWLGFCFIGCGVFWCFVFGLVFFLFVVPTAGGAVPLVSMLGAAGVPRFCRPGSPGARLPEPKAVGFHERLTSVCTGPALGWSQRCFGKNPVLSFPTPRVVRVLGWSAFWFRRNGFGWRQAGTHGSLSPSQRRCSWGSGGAERWVSAVHRLGGSLGTRSDCHTCARLHSWWEDDSKGTAPSANEF